MTSIFEEKTRLEPHILQIEGVVGFGIGKKSPHFFHVYVEKKTATVLKAIPTELNGYDVKIIETGKIMALQRTSKVRPAIGGISCGHISVTAGTLGMVATKNGRVGILGNNHVFANSDSLQNSRANVGDPILQPGPVDGGTLNDTIAKLDSWIKINENGTTAPPVDCAFAAVDNPLDVSDGILDIGNIIQPSDATEHLIVVKSGRTSGVTNGITLDVNATVQVNYGNFTSTFSNQIVTTAMGSAGDSGAILLNQSDNSPVGLLFAGSDTITVFNKIADVVNALGIQLRAGGQNVTQASMGFFLPLLVGGGLLYTFLKKKRR